MSLTDDWKAGTLEDGFYYILTETDETAIVEAQCGDLLVDIPEMILEVLAPVPSYEEQQELKHFDGKNVCLENEVLRLKVERLRDLLKECKNIVAHDLWSRAQFPDGQVVEKDDILTRINTAIGESEE